MGRASLPETVGDAAAGKAAAMPAIPASTVTRISVIFYSLSFWKLDHPLSRNRFFSSNVEGAYAVKIYRGEHASARWGAGWVQVVERLDRCPRWVKLVDSSTR